MVELNKDILTVKEVADYLQCSQKTILNMLNKKLLKGFRLNGYSWRVEKSSIEEYIKKQTDAGNSETALEK